MISIFTEKLLNHSDLKAFLVVAGCSVTNRKPYLYIKFNSKITEEQNI